VYILFVAVRVEDEQSHWEVLHNEDAYNYKHEQSIRTYEDEFDFLRVRIDLMYIKKKI
jgi:hypothetical protein